MAVREPIDSWHADRVALEEWKRDAIAAAVSDEIAQDVRALRISLVNESYNLQRAGLESWYAEPENNMPELSEEEYKRFQSMDTQSTVVDKVLLCGCALIIFWVIVAILGALAAAKA